MLTGALNHNKIHKNVTQQTVNLIFVVVLEGTRLRTWTQPISPPQHGEHYYLETPMEELFVLNLTWPCLLVAMKERMPFSMYVKVFTRMSWQISRANNCILSFPILDRHLVLPRGLISCQRRLQTIDNLNIKWKLLSTCKCYNIHDTETLRCFFQYKMIIHDQR